uniref:Uncharacterized protein n=1 Tax=Nelumbo nucifera TaxID=4432 RepID=A0A822YDE8_NELNU|nr:TPA_asm: hypothetical protein HUJ06_009213 [Nelumbo nucifera]
MVKKEGGRSSSSSSRSEFQRVIDNCSLIDMGFSGNRYTWTNKRVGLANVRERLDRMLANGEWRMMFPRAQYYISLLLVQTIVLFC